MKRGKPLGRGKPLRPDPEKVREFLARGRGALKRSEGALARRTPLRGKGRVRPVEGPLTPEAWRREVFRASDGMSILSGARARDADDPLFHAHHCLPKRELRARGLYGCVWDSRNGVLLTKREHERHEQAIRPEYRIPGERLPVAVWEFCAELDELAGTEWASALVRRFHP